MQRITEAVAGARVRTRRLASGLRGSDQLGRAARSGHLLLATVDAAPRRQRDAATFVVNLDRRGSAADITVVPVGDATQAGAPLREVLEREAAALLGRHGPRGARRWRRPGVPGLRRAHVRAAAVPDRRAGPADLRRAGADLPLAPAAGDRAAAQRAHDPGLVRRAGPALPGLEPRSAGPATSTRSSPWASSGSCSACRSTTRSSWCRACARATRSPATRRGHRVRAARDGADRDRARR